jgi:hypothetical protein
MQAPARMRIKAADCAISDVMLERALFPSVAAAVPPPKIEESFEWLVCPPAGTFCGTVYSDGSRLDGPTQLLARNGWAFVVVDPQGHIVASASGATPDWVDDIPGAEAWALLQAASRAEPGCAYRVDCEPCVKAVHRGRKWATSDRRPHARVYGLLFAALDDTDNDAVVWMPAHTKSSDVGVLRLSNGESLTAVDRMGNAEADRLAKLAVEAHRVPKHIRDMVRDHDRLVEKTARWVAKATHEAGHQHQQPHRDTEASRQLAVAASRQRAIDGSLGPARGTRTVSIRPVALGGHALRFSGGTWSCTACKRKTKHLGRIAPKRCEGPAALRWADKARSLAQEGVGDASGHVRVLSGELVWCMRCGSYATSVAKGLAKPCAGRYQGRWGSGGLAGQLKVLLSGRHPKTLDAIPPPLPESRSDGTGWGGWTSSGRVAPLCGSEGLQTSEEGKHPEPTRTRFAALLERVRAKEIEGALAGSTVVGAAVGKKSGLRVVCRRITGKRPLERQPVVAAANAPCRPSKARKSSVEP